MHPYNDAGAYASAFIYFMQLVKTLIQKRCGVMVLSICPMLTFPFILKEMHSGGKQLNISHTFMTISCSPGCLPF